MHQFDNTRHRARHSGKTAALRTGSAVPSCKYSKQTAAVAATNMHLLIDAVSVALASYQVELQIRPLGATQVRSQKETDG